MSVMDREHSYERLAADHRQQAASLISWVERAHLAEAAVAELSAELLIWKAEATRLQSETAQLASELERYRGRENVSPFAP